jgi:hypothetical protein
MTLDDDLPFKVERWSEGYGRPEETIAMCAICSQPKLHSRPQ